MLALAAVFVTVVASGGAVDEVAYAVVLVGCRHLLMGTGCVAVDAGKAGIICGDLVAIIAHGGVMRNGEVGVIEGSAEPICGGVAGITGRWISGGEVVGDETAESLRAVPGGLMTTETGCIRRGQRIIIVHVTIRAGLHPAGSGHHMSAG